MKRITYDENGIPLVDGVMPQWKVDDIYREVRPDGTEKLMCTLSPANDAAQHLIDSGIAPPGPMEAQIN